MSTMKFCRECNNILYPKEDTEQKILLYACCNCDHQEIAENNCVYRNEIHHSVGKQTQVLQDVAADPTLPRTKTVRCAQCNHGEAVFFQLQRLRSQNSTMCVQCVGNSSRKNKETAGRLLAPLFLIDPKCSTSISFRLHHGAVEAEWEAELMGRKALFDADPLRC